MRNLLFASLFIALWSACQSSPNTTAATTTPSVPTFDSTAEKTAVITAVHGFFDWYDQYMKTPAFSDEKYEFVDYNTPHPALKTAALDAYLDQFVKGGFAGQGFVQRQKAFYQKAAVLWQKEEKGDIPSGMDADPYFCSQEDVAEYYRKATIQVQFTGPDRATATINVTDPEMATQLPVYMQKENGKWLYVGTECELGVE